MLRTFALVWVLFHLTVATPLLSVLEDEDAEGSEGDVPEDEASWRERGQWAEPGFAFGVDPEQHHFVLTPRYFDYYTKASRLGFVLQLCPSSTHSPLSGVSALSDWSG
jgi:hypothetical protein